MNVKKIDFLIALVLGCCVSANVYAAPDVVPPNNIDGDASILAGVGCERACFVDARCPKPFIDSCFHKREW